MDVDEVLSPLHPLSLQPPQRLPRIGPRLRSIVSFRLSLRGDHRLLFSDIVDQAGTYLFRTEVHERNVYKDIHSGLGTLQMQEVTPAIAKARRETMEFVEEIDALLAREEEIAG